MSKETSTRDHLLDTAGHLFAERGFDGLSIRDLAEAAEVNLGAVNYHFRSKEELYMAVFRDKITGLHAIFELFEKQFESPPQEVIPRFIENFMTFVLIKNPHMVPLILRELSAQQSKRLDIIAGEIIGPNFKLLGAYLKHQMDRGRIRACDPLKCSINLVSLCLFPAHMKPLLIRMAKFNPSEPQNVAELARHNSEVFLRAFDPKINPEGSK